ncbi:MAG: PilZ domain-containing protein [bacterium]
MAPENVERRKFNRNTHTSLIEYAFHTEGDVTKDSTAKGITVNVSDTGLCIYLFNPVNEGQEMKIFKGLFASESLSARVKWSKQITDDIYKAGLAFLHPGKPLFPARKD